MDKETKKDILFMLWGFIIGGIFFFLAHHFSVFADNFMIIGLLVLCLIIINLLFIQKPRLI